MVPDNSRVRICVIFNPVARGEKAARLRRHLDDIGSQCALKLTWAAGTARLLAAEAVREGYDTLVAAGGDGTVNEVLNGLVDEPEGLARARFAVLPLGTVNVFAREHNLPTALKPAWQVIQAGRERSIDLPIVEFGPGDRRERRAFVQLAGAGLDARAIQLVNWPAKKLIGPLAYVLAGLRALQEPPAAVELAAPGVTGISPLVLVGNGRFYGGRFPVFPAADPADGRLDVTVFPRLDGRALMRLAWAHLRGHDLRTAGAVCHQLPEFELRAPEAVPLELEGDTVGTLPARFSLRPRALRILVP